MAAGSMFALILKIASPYLPIRPVKYTGLAGNSTAWMDNNRAWANYSVEVLPWQESKLFLK